MRPNIPSIPPKEAFLVRGGTWRRLAITIIYCLSRLKVAREVHSTSYLRDELMTGQLSQ